MTRRILGAVVAAVALAAPAEAADLTAPPARVSAPAARSLGTHLRAPHHARARAATFPGSASRAAVDEPCPPEAEGAVCGHVDVPLDRTHPAAGSIPIAFELYPHTAPGPAESVIIVNFGGPGGSTTSLRFVPPFWFGPALEHHDLLLIDDRGRGRSGVIDCPDYQHGTGPSLLAAVGACAAQLGPAATHYATADIAKDDDAVRAALGYKKVDFVGTSYGGIDAAAYATRFGSRLRSVVLDSPVGEPLSDPFVRAGDGVRRTVSRVGQICRHSTICGRSSGEALDAVRSLTRRLRAAPLTGSALDPNGESHDVTIDPSYLLVHILDAGDFFLTPGEVPAAADALQRGDARPLLRLAAEGDFPIPGDSGDAAEFSLGAYSATFCLDQPWPWSPNAPLATRQAQWAGAVARADDAPFAPFTADEIMPSIFGGAAFCLPWPKTGTRPPVERGARYPHVPTLAIAGGYDLLGKVPETAALFPGSQVVTIAGAGHNTFRWAQCGRDLAATFLETLHAGDTSCASQPAFDYPGVRSFPRRASGSRAATAMAGNHASRRSRRVAHVAVDAALDALKRSFPSNGDGPGLRGGSFHTDYDNVWTTTLTRARWTDDVAVSGTLHWSFDGGPLDADLEVDGPGGRDGSLHLEGGWLIPGAARTITITGTLGGERVSAKVPST